MHTYSGRTLPAHAKVAADGMMRDPQTEPEHGERVPYLVVSGSSRSRLIDQVVSPGALLARPHLRPNFQYYIDKQLVPALDRILSLVGVDVRAWLGDMPRRLRSSIYDEFLSDQSDSDGGDEANRSHSCSNRIPGPEQQDVPFHGIAADKRIGHSRTLDHFYHKRCCILCRRTMPAVAPSPDRMNPLARTATAKPGHWASRLCGDCSVDKAAAMARIGLVHMNISHSLRNALNKCAACVGGPRAEALLAADLCDCLDCPNMFQRVTLSRRSAAWARLACNADDD
ncbi:DNA polymerase zeta [Coemansia guatemalensis]|uniref:DNA-directed DNA polymerase n=1 Tax=Coemansia guatemalensis TaxID=2761395 RepID=A0A9W8LP26_9FUNG|nr:DNA polymerase zeta [Coemansia guatemalensis]